MKKTIIYFARTAFVAIALLAGTSCSETEKETAGINDGKVVLTVNLDSGSDLSMTTRASLDAAGEKKINNVQIFVFNKEDGSLDSYHNGSESKQIKIRCTTGKKRIFSIINAPSLSSYTDTTALMAQTTSLRDNSIGGFVMTGRASATLPAQSTVNLSVSRITSRVCIKSISVDFTSEGYKNMEFIIKSIYMINVAGDTDYNATATPNTWYNQSKHLDDSMDALLYKSINSSLTSTSALTPNEYFYVYPNPTASDNSDKPFTPRYTRLVIEATLGGTTCYYPISLKGLERNKTYTVSSLKITRPGSDDPDKEITSAECPFNIEVEEWITGTDQNLVI
ncbi:MAG: fimbrial protein [Candidatus Cryptobacteroides sp.]